MKSGRLLIRTTAADTARWQSMIEALSGWELECVEDNSQALRRIEAAGPDVVLLADHPPDFPALEFLEELRASSPELPVILVAATADMAFVTRALQLRASDLLVDPVQPAAIEDSLRRLLDMQRTRQAAEILRRQQELPRQFDDFVGSSPAMKKVFQTIQQVATTNVDVLIRGDTGTGKELVARAIHQRSRRSAQPFVAVDCGAIPENLLESEFFGHEKGAFTGADSRRIGLLEFADGGTFFLDEIGELPLLLQAKLLRTLQERKLRRVGGREEIAIDVRIVAATARNLDQMIQEKRFREDLYYRINVVRIDLPPLRERGDDLGLIAEHFAQRYSREMGKQVVGISPEAYQVLSHYRWPGNIRELQNVIRRGIALTERSLISLDDLPDELVTSAGQNDLPDSQTPQTGYFALREACLNKFERDYLSTLLQKHQGNVKSAAAEAELPRGTLYRLMKNQGLDVDQFR